MEETHTPQRTEEIIQSAILPLKTDISQLKLILEYELHKKGLGLGIRPGWWEVDVDIDWTEENKQFLIAVWYEEDYHRDSKEWKFIYRKIVPCDESAVEEVLLDILLNIPNFSKK